VLEEAEGKGEELSFLDLAFDQDLLDLVQDLLIANVFMLVFNNEFFQDDFLSLEDAREDGLLLGSLTADFQ